MRIRSVSRAVEILLLVAEREGQTAAELAQAAGLPRPTCYHLLNTLAAEGALSKNGRRRYYLGPAVGVLSDAFVSQLAPPEHLLAELHRLADTTGETTYASGWRNGEVVVLASVEGRQPIRVARLHRGFSGSAHARSSGKVLLALAAPAAREAYLDHHPLEALTRRTIVRREGLMLELGRIEERGYAVDEEEFEEGVACVSAPVLDNGKAWTAFTVSAPVERYRETRDELIRAVLAAARSASTGPVATAPARAVPGGE
jgi:IclR family acetate operon transcriptional repressor